MNLHIYTCSNYSRKRGQEFERKEDAGLIRKKEGSYYNFKKKLLQNKHVNVNLKI